MRPRPTPPSQPKGTTHYPANSNWTDASVIAEISPLLDYGLFEFKYTNQKPIKQKLSSVFIVLLRNHLTSVIHANNNTVQIYSHVWQGAQDARKAAPPSRSSTCRYSR